MYIPGTTSSSTLVHSKPLYSSVLAAHLHVKAVSTAAPERRRRCFERESRIDNSVEDPNIHNASEHASPRRGTLEIEPETTTRRRWGSEAAAHAQCPAVWGADWSYSALLSITTIYTGPIPVQHV